MFMCLSSKLPTIGSLIADFERCYGVIRLLAALISPQVMERCGSDEGEQILCRQTRKINSRPLFVLNRNWRV